MGSHLPPTLGEPWLQRTVSPLTLPAIAVTIPQSLSAGEQITPVSPAFFLAAATLASQVWVGGQGEWLGFDVSCAEAGRWGCGDPSLPWWLRASS